MRARNLSIAWYGCGLAFIILAGAGCPDSGEPPADLEVTYNIPYAVGNVASGPGATTWEEQPLYLDVYEPPESKAARRALILMHGGSFLEDGKDSDRMVEWASYFARRGFVVFSIDYRLITDYPPTPPAYWELTFMPDAAHAATVDAKAAVRFVRANAASYNVDPNRIAFLGESAGAIAGAGVAITDSGDWASDGQSFPIPEFNNPGVSARVNAYVHFWGNADHVLSEIDANDPPVMICHGNEDDVFLTPFQSAERFNFFLDRIGVPNEFYEADGFGHSAWNYRLRGKSLEVLTLEFLQEQLL